MFIAIDPMTRYAGRIVGDGHCVALVREATSAPHTAQWRRGVKVRDNPTPKGAAIATFGADGRYQNKTDGSSHACVFVEQRPAQGASLGGLLVWDQWRGSPTAQRVIRFKGGQGTPNNDGDSYYVVEAGA